MPLAITFALATPAAPALGDAPAPAPDKAAEKVSLTVTATGFRNTTGQALVALHADPSAWPKLDKAVEVRKVPITKEGMKVTFQGLSRGTLYAVSVIHDENSNGKHDMRWLPLPRPAEGAGVSNDAQATVGPPSWNDARFRVHEGGGAIAIAIRYWD
jgi:uncharacterized protein (DUF2141 family)